MKTAIATAAIASLAFAPTALAADRFEVEFNYAPAEVATKAGAKTTYNRLEKMVEKECAPVSGIRSFTQRSETELCVDQALADAVDQINQPEVTRIHQERRG
ncbi:MAG: UrcA family protein [Pseudomonadota bacterium]